MAQTLSEFMNGPSEEKKRVFNDVIKESIMKQKETMELKVKPRYEEFGDIHEDTVSVTELCSRYSKPFNKSLAVRTANNCGLDIQEVVDMWELKGEIGCDFGNTLHKTLELWIKYGEQPKNELVLGFSDQLRSMFLDREAYISEKKIHMPKLGLIGTIDLQHEFKKGSVDIYDLKTYNDLHSSYGKLLAPFELMKDNNFNKTQLQLAFYKMLVESTGKEVRNMYIVQQKGDELITHQVEPAELFNNKIKTICKTLKASPESISPPKNSSQTLS